MANKQPLGQMIIELGLDDSTFASGMKGVNQQIKTSMVEMKSHLNVMGRSGSEVDILKAKQTGLTSVIEAQNKKVALAKEALDEHKKGLEESGDASQEAKDKTIKLTNEYNKAVGELGSYENQLSEVNIKLATMESAAYKAGESLEKVGSKLASAGQTMSQVGKTLTMGVTVPLVSVGTLATKAAMEFESAFAGVTKTVDGTTHQINTLRQGIIDMSLEIPASTTEISAVAEAAGQLGIATEDVLDFTRVMIDLGESTNLSADEAASSLAKFANITQMSADNYSNLGATIVDLGNNFATTEADIVNMATNLASAGTQVGMSEADIMALATALSSVGLEAQAGGTAFSKALVNMQVAVETNSDSLNDWASVAGMSAQEFAAAFKEDATGALQAFIQGLAECGGETESAIVVLDEMGITETRMRDALLRSANASDVFSSAIEMGSQAWEENNALTEEASKRYETTESKLNIAKNTLTESGRQIGENLLPVVADLAQGLADLTKGFSELSPEAQQNIIKIAGVAAAAGPLLKITGSVTERIGTLTKGLGKLSKKLAEKTAAKAAEKALVGVGDAASTATASTGGLSSVLKNFASPGGVAVAAAAAAVAVGVALYKMNQKAIQNKIDEKFGSIKLSAEEVEDVAKRLTKTDWTVRIDAYVDAKSKLDEFESSIQDSIDTINKFDWKVSVGLDLTEEEQQNYKDSITSYIQSVNDYVEQQHYTTSLALEVTLDANSATYASLSNFTNTYYSSTQKELNELGQQLADAVNKSFEDGTFSEDNPDIQAIREKINEKVQELADQDFKASLENMTMELKSEGLSLDYDSFKKVNDKLSEEIQTYMDGSEDARISTLVQIDAQYQANIDAGMSEATAKEIAETAKKEMELGIAENKTEIIMEGFSFSLGEIDSKYKDDINTAYQEVSDFMLDANFQSIDDFSVALNTAMTGMASSISGDGKKVVQEAFEALAPQKEQLETLAQQYVDAGQEVPESLRQGLSDISQMGAVIGDIDSLYLSMGEQIANSPEKLKALEKMAASGEEIPQELADAIQIYSGKVYDAASGTFVKVSEASNDMQQTIIDELNCLGLGANDALAEALTAGYDNIYLAEDGTWQAVIDATNTKGQEAVNAAISKGGDVSKGEASGIEEYNPLVKDSAAKNAKIIENELEPIGGKSHTWGQHVSENFAGGMLSKLGDVMKASTETARTIADILGHTTPVAGPLKDDDKWMGHMMDNLANGINDNRYKVENAAQKVAAGIQSAIDQPIVPEVDFSTLTETSTFMPEIVPVLNSKMKAIELMNNALNSIETSGEESDNNDYEIYETLEKLVDSNSQMISLLQQIRDKNPNILLDRNSMVDAVNEELGARARQEGRDLA